MYGVHDGPHDCEFCSPEPEPIPAPWERTADEAASESPRDRSYDDEDPPQGVPLTAAITRLWA